MVTRQLQVERRTGKVRRSKTDVLPTVPRNQPLCCKFGKCIDCGECHTSDQKFRPKRVWCRPRDRFLNFNPFNISGGMRWAVREVEVCGLPCFAGFLGYFQMMPEFIRRMRHCVARSHASHYVVYSTVLIICDVCNTCR